MNIPLRIALAATAFFLTGTALAQPSQPQKKPAVVVAVVPDDAAARERARQKQLQFDRLCTYRPVMSDAAIEGCRQAHKL